MAVTKTASTDSGYVVGSLSSYPITKDTSNGLYVATNNSETVLTQSLSYNASTIVVDNNDSFPPVGILRIGPAPGQIGPSEMVYYETKNKGSFTNLIRGFAGSRQNPWLIGSYVTNSVSSQHHNATKDAILNIESNLGTKDFPSSTSLNGILKTQENRFLSPLPLFRAYPIVGAPPLKVRFQNFSASQPVRFLWDFGDGTTSVEKSPQHIYQNEGVYTVTLNVITSLGAQGIITKSNYITVSNNEKLPFFYVTPAQGVAGETAFTFVDQTEGDIVQRYWIFDGPGKYNGQEVATQSIPIYDPNVHTIQYTYDSPGSYQPSLLVVFENQTLQRVYLTENITVT